MKNSSTRSSTTTATCPATRESPRARSPTSPSPNNSSCQEQRPVKSGGDILRDTEGRFYDFDASRRIDTRFRRLTVWIEEKGEEMELLANRFDLSPETIAEIYLQRWQIELFFKAIKQNPRIKTFVGTSANAVRIQIWMASHRPRLARYGIHPGNAKKPPSNPQK